MNEEKLDWAIAGQTLTLTLSMEEADFLKQVLE